MLEKVTVALKRLLIGKRDIGDVSGEVSDRNEETRKGNFQKDKTNTHPIT